LAQDLGPSARQAQMGCCKSRCCARCRARCPCKCCRPPKAPPADADAGEDEAEQGAGQGAGQGAEQGAGQGARQGAEQDVGEAPAEAPAPPARERCVVVEGAHPSTVRINPRFGGAVAASEVALSVAGLTEVSVTSALSGPAAAREVALIVGGLRDVTSLTLDLKLKQLGTPGVSEIARAFDGLSRCPRLAELKLDFWHTAVDRENVKVLAAALAKLKGSKRVLHLELNLKGNHICSQGAIEIAYAIRQLEQLTHLDLCLYRTYIDGAAAKELGYAVAQLKNVRILRLNLQDNPIGTVGAQKLASSLGSLPKLSKLTLLVNGLSCEATADSIVSTLERQFGIVVKKG